MKKGCFCILVILIMALVVFSSNLTAFGDNGFVQNDYDYAKEGDISFSSVDVVGILENLLGISLSEVEKKYLLQNSGLTLTYSDTISISNIMTDFDGASLSVSAIPYSYKSINARGVTWIPTEVNGKTLNENEGKYSFVFDELDESFGDSVSVKYEALLQINYKDINKYVNQVFEMGLKASEKLEQKRLEYEEAERVYKEEVARYHKYLEDYATYLIENEAYRKYLIEYALWQDKVNAYSNYLQEYELYRKELALYEQFLKDQQQYNEDYQAYREYLSLLEAYNRELEIYNEQTKSEEAQTTIYQLSILHYLTTPVTPLERTLYNAIMGGTVTQVLAEKESLVTVGKVEARAVDLAVNATNALRKLLAQYSKYTNDNDRYVFYILCQEELSKNFNDLFRALDFLYHEYPLVRKVVNQMEKKEQFEILLAQLYCMCNALSNDKIPNYIMVYRGKNATGAGFFDDSYRIGDSKRTAKSILGIDGYLEDKDNATPLENGVPNLPTPPKKPDEVKMPTAPKKVNEPIKPDIVERPGDAPKKVNEPKEPEKVNEPMLGEPYEPTAEEVELSILYESGVLAERGLFESNVFYKAQTTVQKYFRNVKVATLYFYDAQEPANLLCVLPEVQLGSYVEYPLEYPKMTKKGYNCTFDGWVDENGDFVDLNRFNVDKSDVYLYPHFKETPILYRVNWRIDSKTMYEDECAFGEKPVFNQDKFGEVTKSKNGLREYRFIGWKKGAKFYPIGAKLEAMTDITATYEAVFEESIIITFVVSGVGRSVSYWQGETPDYDGVPTKNIDSFYFYTFLNWDSPIEPVESDKTYNAVFDATPLVGIKTVTNVNGAKVTFDESYFTADCQASISSNYAVKMLFSVAKQEGKGIKLELAGGNVVFSKTAVNELAENCVAEMYIYFANTSKFKYKYVLKGFDANGNELSSDSLRVDIDAYGEFDEEKSFLYETARNGSVRDVRFSIVDSRILFSARLGSSYQIEPQNTISIIPSKFVEIGLNLMRAGSGEIIRVSLSEPPKGMYIESIYIVTDDGTTILLDDDMSFKMPSQAVSVGVVCAYYEYTITFRSEGKVISVRTYRYGDEVVEPMAVFKADDDKYSYTFIGWDCEVGPVEGDAVYNAVYEAKPLPRESHDQEPTKLTKLLRVAYVVLPMLGVIVIGLIVVIITVFVKKRRKKKHKKEKIAK